MKIFLTKDQTYQCYTCGKHFNMVNNLKIYGAIHTAHEPYVWIVNYLQWIYEEAVLSSTYDKSSSSTQ